ncbi:CpaF family protein [Nocardioides dongkuii]|uniref:CpaF family protein n=1 Tax=Nocardioides dongkuii TaxID=2760089 RepID=UPI0029D41328|nr:ATPase, T2SS/T4P/T4SS family [Nocardioides dongkuii]
MATLRDEDLAGRGRRGLAPLTGDDDRQHTREIVQRVVTNHEGRLAERGESALTWEQRQDLIEAIEARLFGAGSLQQLLEDPEIENIDINGHDRVFVEYADGRTARLGAIALNDDELIENVQTLAAHDGLSARAFDVVNHAVNLRLADGSRLYAVQAVSDTGVLVSIRKHRYARVTLPDLVKLGSLNDELAAFLAAAVRARKNIMIAGATSAGKTTLVRALASEIPSSERLVTVERSLELGLHEDVDRHPNCAALEERLPNAEGIGSVSMADLVRDSLRLNPSRVIVGEVLGDEVVTMLNAMMQGNDGSLSTIHANSSADVVAKVKTYALQAPERLPWEATSGLFAGAIDFVVFIRRVLKTDRQVRVIESVREVAGIDEHGVKTNELFGPDEAGQISRRRLVQVACQSDLEAAGWRDEAPSSIDHRRWA